MGGSDLVRLGGFDERAWKRWLGENWNKSPGAWLVFYKKGSGRPSISYEEALDVALCHGWIDSVIMRIDGTSYARKFTPRRLGSIWSETNIRRVKELTRQGRMTEAGLKLYRERTGRKSQAEQFKVREPPFPEEFMAAVKSDGLAWANFEKLAPSHRKRYLMWITAAKKKGTRDRRIMEAVVLLWKDVKSLLK